MADKEASPAAAAAEAFRRDSQSGPAVELALCIPLNDLRHQTERMSTKVHTLALRLAVFLSDCTHKHANTYLTRSIWKMLGPFATASRRTPPVLILHCHSPGVATVARRLRYSNVKSMSTTTTTKRDRGDRYGPIEWAQSYTVYALIDWDKIERPTRH